jgi:transposase InsO family protein
VEYLLQLNFVATEVDKIWVADFTYVATGEGYLNLALVLDVYSRHIV